MTPTRTRKLLNWICLLTFLLTMCNGFRATPKTPPVVTRKLVSSIRGGATSSSSSPATSKAIITMYPALVHLCGTLAPTASMGLSFTPLPTIRTIQNEKSVGNLPLLPYSSLVCNAIIWSTYGILKKDPKIWSCNVVALLLGSYYTYVFTRFCPPTSSTLPGSVRTHFNAIAGIFTFAAMVATQLPVEKAASILGGLGVLICLILFGSPLSALKTVIQTKSAKSIPLPFTIGTVVNCLAWTILGLDSGDFNIYFPNTVGLFFGLVQVALKLVYGDSGPGTKPSTLHA